MSRRPRMKSGDLGRSIFIHICKDGTISYRRGHEPVFNKVALPVFSVDTEDQARMIQVTFGKRQYNEHPQLPGRPWYRWNDFGGSVDDLDAVSATLRRWWATYQADEKTVPCGLCDTPTRMLGTKRCDRCYELETRIQAQPSLARRILAAYEAPKGATHYFGELLDQPTWVKCTQIGVGGDHWWRWDATKKTWSLISHHKPHWLKELA